MLEFALSSDKSLSLVLFDTSTHVFLFHSENPSPQFTSEILPLQQSKELSSATKIRSIAITSSTIRVTQHSPHSSLYTLMHLCLSKSSIFLYDNAVADRQEFQRAWIFHGTQMRSSVSWIIYTLISFKCILTVRDNAE